MSSHNSLLIRAANITDVERMTHCVYLAYEKYISIIGRKPGPMLDDYASVVSQHLAYVGESDDRIAGLLVLIKQADGLLLDNVAVHPDFQGRGFGGRLVSFAESKARSMGYGALDLYTHELMTDNISAYEKLGYVEIDRRQEKGFSRVYMRKSLDQSIQ